MNQDGSISRTGTTVDGIVKFTDLPYDTYTLTETKAHTDYLLNTTEKTIVLDSETGADDDSKQLTIENEKVNRSVTLIKYNENKTLTLKGATFELRKATGEINVNGKPLYTVVTGIDTLALITNDKGEIRLEDLSVGKYQLIEVKAPVGYTLNSDPIEFEIVEKQEETISVEKTNAIKSTGGGYPEIPYGPTTPDEPNVPGGPEVPKTPEAPKTPETPKIPEKPIPKDKIEDTTSKDTPLVIEPEIPLGSVSEIVEEPKNGKVTIDEKGKWVYTPDPDFVGKDVFKIKITHPDGTEEEIFIEIDVKVPLDGIEVKKEIKKEANNETLPKTGENSPVLLYLAGLFFLLLGIILRKKTKAA